MGGVHVLDHRPRRPAGGEPALGAAGGDDLPGVRFDLGPGPGRLLGIEAGLLEGVLVVVEDRRRRVVRHRVELAVLGVVADHRLDEVVPVDLDLVVAHELPHRIDGAREHHGLGAHLEDLHDVRRVLLAIGGDGGRQRLRVGALANRLDLVLVLTLVELLHLRVDRVPERAGHGVPPGDLGPGHRDAGQRDHGHDQGNGLQPRDVKSGMGGLLTVE